MPRERCLHYKLKLLMMEYDISREDLSEAIGRSLTYISLRMTDKQPWDLDDIYAIRTYFNSFACKGEPELIPLERLHEFFPPRQGVLVRKGARAS